MSAHVNITHPRNRGLHSFEYQQMLRIELLETELKLVKKWHEAVCNDLESIFTRIERGEHCDLHYTDGSVIVIVARQPPKDDEG